MRNPSREASVSIFEASFLKLQIYRTAVSKMKTDTHRKRDILRTKCSVNNTQGFLPKNLRFLMMAALPLWPS